MSLELVHRTYEAQILEGDSEQNEAIEHRGTPLILRGKAGTGKTRTLIEAAVSRIRNGQDPNSILFLTYGRETASYVRDEIARAANATMREPLARTFHSLAFSILKMKRGGSLREPLLISGAEQESFIKELLDGVEEKVKESGKEYWPESLIKAKKTEGFVREIRDLILRCNERGIAPSQLAAYGKSFDEPLWIAVAKFWQDEYIKTQVMFELGSEDAKFRVDPSEVVIAAIGLLESDAELLQELRQRFQTIMVDEFQESDPMQRRFLELLAGEDLLIAVDTDSAVGRFRGADPDGAESALALYISRGREITLKRAHRAELKPSAFLFRSENEEAHFIAHRFKREHLMNGTSYSEMAVILRSPGSFAASMRRAFMQVGIPVVGYLDVLGKNPALAPFILLARVATKDQELNVEICEKLLLSEFGGADSISLRRIRRSLLLTKKESDPRTGNQLIIDAIDKGEIFIEEKSALVRIHELLEVARRASRKKNVTAEIVLGAIWDNALNSQNEKISLAWKREALKNSARSVAADRDLDAMIQLFEEAARFSERMPQSAPSLFLRQISQENIAADVITAKGVRSQAVEILTVHAAKGREWEYVAVAGVQDGLWPNLKQRSSLLGSERLVEHCRYPEVAKDGLRKMAADGLRKDEERLFHVALTRATTELIVTAASDEELVPSTFFEELIEGNDDGSLNLSYTDLERQLSMSALVADLRRTVVADSGAIVGETVISENDKQRAASLLKTLAESGISIADPVNWYGYLPLSSTDPVVPEGEDVSVSPSGGENFEKCGLKWFLERQGGSNGETTAQLLGTIIHEFARAKFETPDVTTDELYNKMEKAWKVIDENSGWVSNLGLERAMAMITRFVNYHERNLQSRKIVGVEQRFVLKIGRAVINGSADRIEINSDGELYIIDFKTGKTVISENEALDNLQMAAYQLAAVMGKYKELTDSTKVAGAELAFLGHERKKTFIALRTQAPLTDEFQAAIQERIQNIAEGMGAATYVATIGDKCENCGVKSSCPLQSNGRTVIS